ncbi:Alpha-aminoadipate--LysW ligase LysX [Anatilimnocola aggregata]|uniref:Alpha-aminoadipate--LysW ligase LysX n=1 Tax=Anatilimnocola aggregata TaxID=2528021 RepID=A0A517Y5D6_9BACT|nr:RimK family alpha-L-glutamate ligase [Anatilimnocola aggregata]QDU25445.1 Alpha-aminoadipate--LysW ligase LysX [Anatilimnocola aggregata]
MRIAVLAAPDSWYARDLQRAAGDRCEVSIAAFSEMKASIPRSGAIQISSGECNLSACEAILVRTMPPGSLEQVVFRMDCLARYEAAGGIAINPTRAVEAAVDKFLTSAKLQSAGLLTPRTIVCQSFEAGMQAFEELGGDVVVKPLFGSEGRGLIRLQDSNLALRAFKMLAQLNAVLYVQEFIPHEGEDWRLLVLGEQVFGMRRRNPHDWRTNVSRGASTAPLEVTPELRDLALRAAAAVQAPIAGVDLLPARDGQLYVLEVNAVPGWKALARTLDVDIARHVIDFTAAAIRSRD